MLRSLCLVIGFFVIAAAAPELAAAQEGQGQDQEAMMKAYLEAAKPGPAHAKLAEMAGDWDYVMRTYDDPEHPMEITGTATMTMVMGGRYLRQETDGMMMGSPFNGVGVTGYNNATKEYESIWYDNMGTGIMKSVGSDDGTGKVVMHSEYTDPLTGKTIHVKTVSETVSKDEQRFVWYNVDGDTEVKSFEITYTRRP
jgi:hypothetical protein